MELVQSWSYSRLSDADRHNHHHEPILSPQGAVAEQVVIYTRVSAAETKANLDSQAQRLQDYCAARGWQVKQMVKEVGSGVDDERPKLLKLLTDPMSG